jgi:hypothetical protein
MLLRGWADTVCERLGPPSQGIKTYKKTRHSLRLQLVRNSPGRSSGRGLAPLLSQIQARYPPLRTHMVGHGYGARLVTVAAAILPAAIRVASSTLLQPALSHDAFAVQRGGRHEGAFRGLLTAARIAGPVVITHMAGDRIVGTLYALASLISGGPTSAFADEDDRFGTLGRNGARHTPEVSQAETTLRTAGARYSFAPGRVYNLEAHQVVHDHRDVANPSVAGLIANVVASDAGARAAGAGWVQSPLSDIDTPRVVPAQPESAAPRMADPADAAVFCPAAVAKSSVFLVQVFLYPPGAEATVSAEARSADETAARRGAYSLPVDLPHGTRIDVHLDFAVLGVAEPDAVIVWRGRAASVQSR